MTGETATTALQVIFWGSALVVGFAYAGYPLLLVVAARLWGTRPTPPQVTDVDLPTVTLLIVAHNEAAVIASRLEDALAIEYPRDRFEIVVASDGSTDDTDHIVRTFAPRGVRLDTCAERRGKSATLNRVLDSLTSRVIVLSDANTFTAPDAVRNLARWFADPSVGVVCGRLILVDHVTGHNVDGLYWRIETALKSREAELGAIIGVNGAIYALRRSVFTPIPDDTIIDDLVLPLQARLATGCRLLFDGEVVATEETAPHVQVEFRRRVRIGTGGFQAVALLWRLLDPRRGWIALSFFSHKVLRWLCPFFLIAIFAANVALARQPVYRLLLVAQGTFHLAAAYMVRSEVWGRLPRLLRLAMMFHSMNLALLVGFWAWVRGEHSGAWQRTERRAVGASPAAAPVSAQMRPPQEP